MRMLILCHLCSIQYAEGVGKIENKKPTRTNIPQTNTAVSWVPNILTQPYTKLSNIPQISSVWRQKTF